MALSVRVLLGLLLVASPRRSLAPTVWTATALEKVRPGAPPPLQQQQWPRAVTLSAARNEFEAMQVVVTGPAAGVSVEPSELSGPGPAIPVRLFRAAIVDLAYASGPDGASGRWPDALVPTRDEFYNQSRNAFPFTVPAGESWVIWCEVFVPLEQMAGQYAGTLTVTWEGVEGEHEDEDGRNSAAPSSSSSIAISLNVHTFTLPSVASLKSQFGFGYDDIIKGHGLSYGLPLSELREKYNRFALDHRVSLGGIDDGNLLNNFETVFNQSIGGTDAPVAPAICPQLVGSKMTDLACPKGSGLETACVSYAHRHWGPELGPLFDYTCDEPPNGCQWPDIVTRAAAVHTASPNFKTLVTTTITEADKHQVTDSINILVSLINFIHGKGKQYPSDPAPYQGNQRPKYDAFLQSEPHKELWLYQSCMSHGCGSHQSNPVWAGWASYMIDHSAVRNRAMQWLCYNYNVSGELYFETATNFRKTNPWSGAGVWDFGGNGDGSIFYPGIPSMIGGNTHVPISSIRLKHIRDGYEDYEYLKLVEKLGDGPFARQAAKTLFPTPFLANETTSAQLYATRAALAARIAHLQSASASAPFKSDDHHATLLGGKNGRDNFAVSHIQQVQNYGLTVADNQNNSMHGFARVVTVTSPGQFRISFSGVLQGCGDHIVDLVNDPDAKNPLNPAPPSWTGDPGSSPTSYVWRTCLASELDNVAHNGYLDANMGTSIPREMYPYMSQLYLDSLGVPLVDIDVLIQSPVRVQIRTRTFWSGYNGRGPDAKLDGNHTNEKIFTIYRDGKIYVSSVDTLANFGGGGEMGGASGEQGPTGANSAKSTFIHPINAKSQAGFTLATNYSMDALSLYPRGGGVAKWLLQWGQDTQPDPVTKIRCNASCTAMNFLQVPHNSSMSISQTKRFDSTYFQPMQQSKPSWNAGYRWGVSPNALAFPMGSSYTKNYLYQLGTAGSSLLQNIVTLGIAEAIADAYLYPARVTLATEEESQTAWGGDFDPSTGCYRIVHGSAANTLRFALETATDIRHPVFCINADGAKGTHDTHQDMHIPESSPEHQRAAYLKSVSIGGQRLSPREVVSAVEGNNGDSAALIVVVQILRTLPPGLHDIQIEER